MKQQFLDSVSICKLYKTVYSGLHLSEILNEDLLKFFKVKYINVYQYFSTISCIGSILEYYTDKKIKNNKTIHIFGSGFIAKPNSSSNEKFYRPIQFHILRGKLSRERCEKITGKDLSSVTLGDPGLLISKIFSNIKPKKKFDVGIILHFYDKNENIKKHLNFKNISFKFIDIELDTKKFVEEVASCKFILSSAMHGLICADSLNIPNKHIILSDKVEGGTYKFLDYYSVFPYFKYNPINLYKTNIILNNDDINNMRKEYNIKKSDVKKIQKNLQIVILNFNHLKNHIKIKFLHYLTSL